MNRPAQRELLSRRLFFDPPAKQVVRISPDGRWIAFQAPIDGVLNLWLAPAEQPEKARLLTTYADRKIGPDLQWAHDNRHVLLFRDKAGDENWRVWSIDIETGEPIALSPGKGVKAYVQQASRHFPEEVLIAHNERDRGMFDIYRVNVATGANSLVEKNDGFFSLFTDHRFQLRLAKRYSDDGGIDLYNRNGAGAWEAVTHIPAEDTLTTWPVEYSEDGKELYWIDSRGRDTAAAVAQDVKSGAVRILAEDRRADVTALLLDPQTTRPVAAASLFDRTRWQVLDPEYRQDFDILAAQLPGDLIFSGMSDDRSRIIVVHRQDTHPLEYYCYDRISKSARKLFSEQPGLENAPLVSMEPVVARARDGLDLPCYLSQPRGAGPGPVPMVLLVHGGPWARDVWGMNSMHQWLANRGYAVLSVNFRGSTGFGKAFINAANMEWGGKMHDDLIDAVDWAIAQGIADPARVAWVAAMVGMPRSLASPQRPRNSPVQWIWWVFPTS